MDIVAALDGKLGEDLGDVELGGAQGDAETLGDLFVGEALAQECQHFPLARGKDVGVWRAAASVHQCQSTCPVVELRCTRLR